jgi:uncharacterized protein YacL
MQRDYFFIRDALILLGLILILIGKYSPIKILLPNRAKYKVSDENNYVKCQRMMIYCNGLSNLLLGIVLLFIGVGFLVVLISLILDIILLYLFLVIGLQRSQKYIERINQSKNKL